MNLLNFKSSISGNVFEYHFYPNDAELIIENEERFSSNERLWKNWCEQEEQQDLWDNYNVASNASGENALLYLLFIRALSEGKNLLGVGIWQTDWIQQYLNQTPELVDWEYTLEHEFVTHDKYLRQNVGFTKAQSPVLTQYNKPVNETPTDKTGLFKVSNFKELADFLKPGFGDAYSLSNFYLTRNCELMVKKLRSKMQPSLEHLLNDDDILIGLLIGEDSGYYDYIYIASKMDLTSRLDEITDKLNRFATEYISSIREIEKVNDMLKIIEQGVKKYAL